MLYTDYTLYCLVCVFYMCFCLTDQLLHVGLLTEENRQARNAKWRTQEAAGTVSAQSQKQVRDCYYY